MSSLYSLSLGFFGASALAYLMLRWLSRSKPLVICHCRAKPGLHCIITGATSGLGRAASFLLARHNWKLTLACRDLASADQVRKDIIESTNNPHIEVEYLDLLRRDSIEQFVKKVSANPIHVLINNAGIMASKPRPIESFGHVNADTATNYLGPFYLTYLLLPFLQKHAMAGTNDGYPRIVFVASSLATKGSVDNLFELCSSTNEWNTQQAYANSKLACCLLASELNRRYGPTSPNQSLNTYCLFTGGMVNTRLSREVLADYSAPLRWIGTFLSRALLKSPEEGCQTIVHCSVSPNVIGAHGENSSADVVGSGHLYSNCVPIPWFTAGSDSVKSGELWNETMRFLNIPERS